MSTHDSIAPAPSPMSTPAITHTIATTSTPPSAPPQQSEPFSAQLQGWGTVAAVIVALIVAVVGWIITSVQRGRDQRAAAGDRKRDRADADRRLMQEHQAAEARLQKQLDEQRARDRRDFLIAQLQQLSDLALVFATDRMHFRATREQIRSRLLLVPESYATLMRRQVQMGGRPEIQDVAEQFIRNILRSTPDAPIQPSQYKLEWIQAELADNIADLIGVEGSNSTKGMESDDE